MLINHTNTNMTVTKQKMSPEACVKAGRRSLRREARERWIKHTVVTSSIAWKPTTKNTKKAVRLTPAPKGFIQIGDSSVQSVTVHGENKLAYLYIQPDDEDSDDEDSDNEDTTTDENYYLVCGEKRIKVVSGSTKEGPESMTSHGSTVYIVMNRAGFGMRSSIAWIDLETGVCKYMPLSKVWSYTEMPKIEISDDTVTLWGVQTGALSFSKRAMDETYELHQAQSRM